MKKLLTILFLFNICYGQLVTEHGQVVDTTGFTWRTGGALNIDQVLNNAGGLTKNRIIYLNDSLIAFVDTTSLMSFTLYPQTGSMAFSSPLGKSLEVSDANDRSLLQYDGSHKITVNSGGTSIDGSLILNTVSSGANTDSILTKNPADGTIRQRSISLVNINLTGTLNGDWLRWNTSGSYFENFTPDSSTLYAWSRYGNSALSRTANYIGSWDTSEVHINQGGTSVITIDSLKRVGIGTIDPAYPVDIQKVGSGVTAPILNIFGYSGAASANAAYIRLGKSRASALGTLTATGSADFLGAIDFQGVSSTNILATPARIFVVQDGTGGLTQIPGRFAFYTGDTTGAASEKMTIKASGTVGIGIASPAVTSLLDLTSTTKGLLIPRMNTTQQNSISSPATGLMIWNSDSLSNVLYNGTAWLKVQYAVNGASGSGTVTSVSVVTANGVSGSVATSTTTPAITLTLGAITPSTVVTSGNITYGGTIQTTTSTNSNLYVLGPTILGAAISAATYKLTADNIQFRVGIRGSTSTVATAGTDPFAMIIGDNSYTEATSGTSLLGGGLAVATQTFTGGSGATTDFQNVYIADAPASTATNNWALNVGTVNHRSKSTWDNTTTTAGTTGNQTINKSSGTVNIAAAGTTVTVTNSLVSATSLVFAVIRTNDATARISNVVPAAGSFAINIVACTAEVSIGFWVIN